MARGLTRAGRDVVLSARDAHKETTANLVSELGVEVLSPANAAAVSDFVILALPWKAAEEALSSLGDLTGKIVVDCMHPVGVVNGVFGLEVGHSTSGAEIVAA